ncbi:MAG: hypothetical protein QOI95_2239 [Acidimicrobiaceae bacterium]
MTVSAPLYLSLLTRAWVLDIRGRLTLEPDYVRWRPTGWYGRRSPRSKGFEVPLTELGSIRILRHRFFRASLIFEDLHGYEIKADGNRRVIQLQVKERDAQAVLRAWSFLPSVDDVKETETVWQPH